MSTFLPVLGGGGNAYADPPPWAPAHGYREQHQHDRNHEREVDDDEDEDRGKRVRVVPAQPVFVAPYGISQGTCNRALLGKVLGGAAGAAIGTQIGRGNGNTAAIIGGAILGVIWAAMLDSQWIVLTKAVWGRSLNTRPMAGQLHGPIPMMAVDIE